MIRIACLTTITAAIAVGTACNSDRGITGLCGFPQAGFDIEEASTLEDAQAYSGMHDAVVLTYEDAADLPEGTSWRVRSVEIMPLIDSFSFGTFPDGLPVTVEVWDADNPLAEPYSVTRRLFKGDLDWTEVQLTNPTTSFPGPHMQTWWHFSFEEVIPASGMRSSNYIVGVNWDQSGLVPLGYSNFNNPCDRNWTDYNDGFGWVLNEDRDFGSSCSWPMLRVNIETLEQVTECEGESYAVE